MRHEIKTLMAEVFMNDLNDISDSIKQNEFEKWDSLQHLNLILAIEKNYKVQFEPEEIAQMTSIPVIEKYILLKIK